MPSGGSVSLDVASSQGSSGKGEASPNAITSRMYSRAILTGIVLCAALLLSGCMKTWCPDDDGDGYAAAHRRCIESVGAPYPGWISHEGAPLDCDDFWPETHPGAVEICEGCRDEDCDGLRDCEDPDCEGTDLCANIPPGEPCRHWPE